MASGPLRYAQSMTDAPLLIRKLDIDLRSDLTRSVICPFLPTDPDGLDGGDAR